LPKEGVGVRLLLLQSSGRTAGNTALALGIAEAALRAEAAARGEPLELETIHLAQMDIRSCAGCRTCFNKGETACPLKDDLLSIKERMKAADGILLAGPVYVHDVNGVMKNWIDRMAHVCHRPEFAGKTALLITTTGGTPVQHALRTMQVALWTWGFRTAGTLGLATGAAMPVEEMKRRHSAVIGRAARKLFQDVRRKAFMKPSFLSLMVFRIQQSGWGKSAPGSIDYAYWNDRGWLDARHCSYFFPHSANPVKVAVARAAGAVTAAFMS
jgi:multimeric flavodoxin WrbA